MKGLMRIEDLECEVIGEYCCLLDIFWENVGKDKARVYKEVERAKDVNDLHKIIERYI